MSLEFKSQNLNIKAIGSKATVPDNNLAKLMYYLHCVFSVIQLEGNDQYTQYQNYNLVTKEEEIEIIGLVKLYEPKIMIKLNLFIVDPYLVPSDVSNEFFELTDERINEPLVKFKYPEIDGDSKSEKELQKMADQAVKEDKKKGKDSVTDNIIEDLNSKEAKREADVKAKKIEEDDRKHENKILLILGIIFTVLVLTITTLVFLLPKIFTLLFLTNAFFLFIVKYSISP